MISNVIDMISYLLILSPFFIGGLALYIGIMSLERYWYPYFNRLFQIEEEEQPQPPRVRYIPTRAAKNKYSA